MEHLLNQLSDIYRPIVGSETTATGIVTRTFAASPTYSDVPCKLDVLFDTSQYVSSTPGGIITGNELVCFYMPDVDVQFEDRVVIDSINYIVRPFIPIYGMTNKHHLEVILGMEET